MPKSRLTSNAKKLEIQTDDEFEPVCKIRSSRVNRYTRQTKFLFRTEVESFQIRKALNHFVCDELDALGRKTYFQRVFILASNIDEEKLNMNCEEMSEEIFNMRKPNYREYFHKHFEEIFEVCERKKCTQDHLTGLCVVMETHTLLLIGGAEDMIANFFEELSKIHDLLWQKSKVFLVNDIIGETYFNLFYSRYAPAININEKFPPATINDPQLMAVQHLKIKEKVILVVETLSEQIKQNAQNLEEETEKPDDPFLLPADPFNKLLPEIQRIDLVLNADKFYYNVQDFALTYRVIPSYQDEDALFWPIQNNYTPLGIFERSPFDVNLTFGNYGTEEKKENEENADNTDSHDTKEEF